ncbi:hypothetical protein [Butyrivibrio proteoclasticus]|uniref:hypothetical protein n=1 Tax=Butyrivibrio proteoclasticus TaxID=43305 RepID=UPI00047B2A82|nr:hypothetical protein [Butyrivibrio proteoclasticus]
MLDFIGLILSLSFMAIPLAAIFFLVKFKKNWIFSLATVVITAAAAGIEILFASMASDFHTAAFILQLFMPIMLFNAIALFIIGNVVLLAMKGLFTKRNLGIIGVVVASIIVVGCVISFTKVAMDKGDYKNLPDIAAYQTSYDKEPMYVIWDSARDKTMLVEKDSKLEMLFSGINPASSHMDYREVFAANGYDGLWDTKVYSTKDLTKEFISTGGQGDKPYGKIFCYDFSKKELELIVDEGRIYDFDVSFDESYLVYSTSDKLVKYDIASKTSTVIAENYDSTKNAPSYIRLSKDGRYIIYGYGYSGLFKLGPLKVYVYDTETNKVLIIPIKKLRSIRDLDFYE